MSYTSVETALATILKVHDDWNDQNVAAGDYRIFSAGLEKAIILSPGPFIRRTAAERLMQTNWVINLELYIAYGGEISTVAENIRTVRESVMDHIDKYPTLDGESGVLIARLTEGGDPEPWQIGNSYFWRQLMKVEIFERDTVVYA